jgi:hypothetical protein
VEPEYERPELMNIDVMFDGGQPPDWLLNSQAKARSWIHRCLTYSATLRQAHHETILPQPAHSCISKGTVFAKGTEKAVTTSWQFNG